MAGRADPPLDEIQWRSPDIAASMGGIHTNSVLPYFSQSPFFDPTSNNAALTTQATYNQAMIHLLQTREAFEGRLQTMQGLEFMVASGPDANAPFRPGEPTTWVIRKQVRRHRPGETDEITILSTYFVVGENVYMAPSIGKVLESRLLSTITSLTDFFELSASLPSFSAAGGYSYKSHHVRVSKDALGSSIEDKQVEPLGEDSSESKGGTVVSSALNPSDSKVVPLRNLRALEESFHLSLKYENDYIDEIPLSGEPGHFILLAKGEKKEVANKSAESGPVKPPPKPAVAKPTPISVDIPPPKPGVIAKDKSPTSATKPKRRKSKAAPLSAGGSAVGE